MKRTIRINLRAKRRYIVASHSLDVPLGDEHEVYELTIYNADNTIKTQLHMSIAEYEAVIIALEALALGDQIESIVTEEG